MKWLEQPVGKPEETQGNFSEPILNQVGTLAEVFCEGFDTEKGRPRERPQKSNANAFSYGTM